MGWMHNRVRMIVGSFLTKNLLLHWKDGEKWFFDKLVDADIGSNSAGWQWISGSGADASPYFRIFNPLTQQKKFDGKNTYVNQWLPELNTPHYPRPMVDHKYARERALQTYQECLYKDSLE